MVDFHELLHQASSISGLVPHAVTHISVFDLQPHLLGWQIKLQALSSSLFYQLLQLSLIRRSGRLCMTDAAESCLRL